MLATSMVLVRVRIGKAKNCAKLHAILVSVPLRPEVEGWNCVAWVQEAVETTLADKGTLDTLDGLTWQAIRDAAMWYVEQKKAAHPFDGQGRFDMNKVATWDLLKNVETTP